MKPIEKAERYTLSKLVVQNLKQYMAERKMTLGDKLPAERELAQLMNVSRAILREALRSLESAGILEIRHGEGAFLAANSIAPLLEQLKFSASMSGANGAELLQIRHMLEASAIDEQTAQGGVFPIEEMERLLAEIRSSADDAAWAEADASFHLAIVRSLGNESLTALAELFIRQTDSPSAASRRSEAEQEHVQYVQALRNRDTEQAKKLLRAHLEK